MCESNCTCCSSCAFFPSQYWKPSYFPSQYWKPPYQCVIDVFLMRQTANQLPVLGWWCIQAVLWIFTWINLFVHLNTVLMICLMQLSYVNRNLCFVCRVCPENGFYLLFVRLIYDCLNILIDLKKKLNLNLLVCGACPENWSWLAGTCQSTQTIGRSNHKNRKNIKKKT